MENPFEKSATTNGGGDSRHRSSIAFPYNSLRDAELVAETLMQSWGGSATQDQIAGSLGTTPRSGTFRNKLGAARIFGAISVSRGNVKLTDLGHRLVDPAQKPAARVEAFFTVPLFEEIYKAYEGKTLPPDKGLERKIAELGVSPKQTAKARQTLKASAQLAGFFQTDRSRLIRPAATNGSGNAGNNEAEKEPKGVSEVGSTNIPLGDLWLTLLDESADWSAAKTKKFVDAARDLREVMAADD
jgi:hypothetical protein